MSFHDFPLSWCASSFGGVWEGGEVARLACAWSVCVGWGSGEKCSSPPPRRGSETVIAAAFPVRIYVVRVPSASLLISPPPPHPLPSMKVKDMVFPDAYRSAVAAVLLVLLAHCVAPPLPPPPPGKHPCRDSACPKLKADGTPSSACASFGTTGIYCNDFGAYYAGESASVATWMYTAMTSCHDYLLTKTTGTTYTVKLMTDLNSETDRVEGSVSGDGLAVPNTLDLNLVGTEDVSNDFTVGDLVVFKGQSVWSKINEAPHNNVFKVHAVKYTSPAGTTVSVVARGEADTIGPDMAPNKVTYTVGGTLTKASTVTIETLKRECPIACGARTGIETPTEQTKPFVLLCKESTSFTGTAGKKTFAVLPKEFRFQPSALGGSWSPAKGSEYIYAGLSFDTAV